MKRRIKNQDSNRKPTVLPTSLANWPKSFSRPFSLQIAIPPFNKIAFDVLESIEDDILMVFDARDFDLFNDEANADGVTEPFKRAKNPISIREWLCISCQVIRWDVVDEFENPNQFGVYKQNAADVIYPVGTEHFPPGPTAFCGEIILRREKFPIESELVSVADKLSFVIAHELTHAFDKLRVLVPAIQDWSSFWKTALQEGVCCDRARLLYHYQSLFVDDYGSENELAMVEQYWPTHAEKWFKAFRG